MKIPAINDSLVMVPANVLGISVGFCLCRISAGRFGRHGRGGSGGGSGGNCGYENVYIIDLLNHDDLFAFFSSLPW